MLNRLGYAPGEKDLRLAKACLDRAEEIFATRMSNIHRRREILAEGLKKLGWRVRGSRTVPFIWAKHPARSTSVAFARRLFAKAGVRVAPGTDFGEAGEGWLRLSLSGDEKTLMEAVGRLSQHSRIWQRKYRPGA
jgi:aspartate/methionine/tyrosine aminotransferase